MNDMPQHGAESRTVTGKSGQFPGFPCASITARLYSGMSNPACPLCEMTDVLIHDDRLECATCGHEWAREAEPDAPEPERVVKDAYGNVLADGDIVAMIKDLKLQGSSQVLKTGTKSKPIRLVEGDHEISCKMDGIAIGLKACFVKKVVS